MFGKGRSTSSVFSNDFTSSDSLGEGGGEVGKKGGILQEHGNVQKQQQIID